MELSQPFPIQTQAKIHGFYLHIPFCFHKCHYCDFYSLVDDQQTGDRQKQFTLRLIQEIHWWAQTCQLQPQTIFIGGGTPTFLKTCWWEQILHTMQTLGITRQVHEWTVEANPETVTHEIATLLQHAGVNRISMGAQSFDPSMLKVLERWHDPQNVQRAMEILRNAGIDNINLDLIFATPGQTLQILENDLNRALALKPNHLSCYGLTFEPHTALQKKLELNLIQKTDEDLEKSMYAHIMHKLHAAGFEHYEVSNWAKKTTPTQSARCQHNLVYWNNQNWLGIGPSAASHIEGHRWKNIPHLGKYLDSQGRAPSTEEEYLPIDRRIGEKLMLGLRLRTGVPWAWVEQVVQENTPRRKMISQWLEMGMLEHQNEHLRLTEKGLFVADAVIAELL